MSKGLLLVVFLALTGAFQNQDKTLIDYCSLPLFLIVKFIWPIHPFVEAHHRIPVIYPLVFYNTSFKISVHSTLEVTFYFQVSLPIFTAWVFVATDKSVS